MKKQNKKSANTAKQVSAQTNNSKKIAELTKTNIALQKEVQTLRNACEKMIVKNYAKQVELRKSKHWAQLRSDQVGQLINVLELNAQTENAKICTDRIEE